MLLDVREEVPADATAQDCDGGHPEPARAGTPLAVIAVTPTAQVLSCWICTLS